MAVMVMVSGKDGTSIQKVIIAYAVMLTKLLTVICILPGVDSSEHSSFSNYSSINTTTSTYTTTATSTFTTTTTSTSTTSTTFTFATSTSNKKTLSPFEKAFTVIGAIVSILTVIAAFCTFYHEFYKTQSTVNHGGNSRKNSGDNYNVYFCNEKTVNVCNKSVTIPTTIHQNQIETNPNPDQKIDLIQD